MYSNKHLVTVCLAADKSDLLFSTKAYSSSGSCVACFYSYKNISYMIIGYIISTVASAY